jgi:two-component system sensor histidine kinase/response regulator
MDGIETSRLIRDTLDPANQPKIILATAYEKESARRQAGELDINGFLHKPVNASSLYDSIMNAFEKKTGGERRNPKRSGFDKGSLDPVRGAHILLVEDNEINQQVAQELLEGAGFFVDIANHGREALEKLAEYEYETVLMDIQMPVMDGYEATFEIRSHLDYKDLPVLAMTASATVDDRKRVLSSGMNDHIAKPIDPNQLFITLLKWIKPGDRKLPEAYLKTKNSPQETGAEQTDTLPSELPGIDITVGLSRVGGNTKLFRNLLQKFSQNQSTALDLIKDALQGGDLELAERVIHTLKGVSGNVGAMELHVAARDLETGIKDDPAAVPSGLFELVQEHLETVLNSVQKLSHEEAATDSAGGGKIDRDVVDPLLEELMELLEEDDTDAVDIVEKLQVMLKGSKAGMALSEVEKSIDQYDFEEAMEQLQKVNELITNIEG